MKLKIDFISNSSSSTFVVAFEKKIVAFEDVEFKILREAKARQVLKDALAQKPKKINPKSEALIQLVTDELTYGYFGPDYQDFQEEFCNRENISTTELYNNVAWMQSYYQEYKAAKERICRKGAVKFLRENEGSYLYIFNYSDEDGEFGSEMEHGFTFQSLPHITISKH